MTIKTLPGMQMIKILAIVLAVGGGWLLFRYGTLAPCGILRVRVREEAATRGGADAFLVNAMSDSLLDTALGAQYGPLTPGRCLSIVLRNEHDLRLLPPQ